MLKLVILDRDGTLNAETDAFIARPEQWQALPGALEAVARLNQAGYTVVIAANVPGLGRGLIDMAALNEVHARLHKELAAAGGRIDSVFFCPHVPEDQCDCRKPKPGLFTQIGLRYGVDLAQVHAVGNSLADVQAARAAGCRVHLVLTGRGRPDSTDPLPAAFGDDVHVHADLGALAQALVAQAPSAPPPTGQAAVSPSLG
ncbi:D-glycero-beta-D-manno-heptose-1,7-bisphosphate 7-phosphatase [Comamonas serinivorans]|uniref:D-glycero-beta-D-manno-heptose-1,7-bisphosphate 7-phosphatase n=1 Tax=Comamonas serinivorans TaxID=1082851 RepID=A0A1Y0ETM3_9BURK|nr:D-glycero-beta-D-manno-heptose 1,7-bisphosphate 7-phosphatase [Comamonas serinivorans]ARU06592.1 D-glycero-beta-D-manno-heptose-1,7-bisphosphate 7-phosphatase [Comamonas serinivorans]